MSRYSEGRRGKAVGDRPVRRGRWQRDASVVLGVLVSASALVACNTRPVPPHRVELRPLPGDRVELVPKEGTPPLCLAFTIAERQGVVRQLTMSPENKSIECPPGQPIGGVSYRIPPSEGKVRIYVFFSDQKLSAESVAHQVSDLSSNPNISALDLRLPGRVVSDVLNYPE